MRLSVTADAAPYFMKRNNQIPNAICLIKACQKLAIPYTFYDDNHNLIGVTLDREYFFANASTPFNDESMGKIFKDKEFMYHIVSGTIQVPKTVGFLDPDCNPDYQSYVKFTTHDQILNQVEREFSYPLIIKMNSGSRGINVFKCPNRPSARKALKTIYNKKSQYYDYVVLVQQYIKIRREFRVIVFQGNIALVYEKDFSAATVSDNISPLHQENSKTVLITDKKLLNSLCNFLTPLFNRIRFGFAGLDVVIDVEGVFWLIEINSKPGFEYFVRDNGFFKLTEIYEKMLKSLINIKF